MSLVELKAKSWNYDADLDLLKALLAKTSDPDTEKIRNLISECLRLAEKYEIEVGSRDGNRNHRNDVNPLDVNLILSEVLSYVPVGDLLNCRFVNQFWNAKCVTWLQVKKMKLVNPGADNFPRFRADFEKTEVLPFAELVITLEDLSLDECSQFFLKHGSKIRTLQIVERRDPSSTPKNDSTQGYLKKIKTCLKYCPKLKTLQLYLDLIPELIAQSFHEQDLLDVKLPECTLLRLHSLSKLDSECLQALFEMLPNINTLAIENLARVTERNQNQTKQNYHILVRALKNLNVQTVFFSESVDPTGFLQSMTMQGTPRLRALSMIVESPWCVLVREHRNERILAQMEALKSQSEYLKSLYLTLRTMYRLTEDNQEVQRLEFPVMKNLTNLTLSRSALYFYDHDYQFQDPRIWPLAPLKAYQLPNLRVLHIAPDIIDSGIKPFADEIFPSVHEIYLGKWREHADLDVLPLIGTWFPNLKKLTNFKSSPLILESDTSSEYMSATDMIVENLQNIQELELKFFVYRRDMKNINLIMGGIPLDSSWAVTQLGERVGFETLPSWIQPPGRTLADLKCLKQLVLKFKPKSDNFVVPIDEIGVYFAFLRLPPKLRLTLRGDFSISDDLAAKLTAHFQNIIISPTSDLTSD